MLILIYAVAPLQRKTQISTKFSKESPNSISNSNTNVNVINFMVKTYRQTHWTAIAFQTLFALQKKTQTLRIIYFVYSVAVLNWMFYFFSFHWHKKHSYFNVHVVNSCIDMIVSTVFSFFWLAIMKLTRSPLRPSAPRIPGGPVWPGGPSLWEKIFTH